MEQRFQHAWVIVMGRIMRLHRYQQLSRRESLPKRSFGRWIVAALGLGVLLAALAGATDPYRQVREFRVVMVCEQAGDHCLGDERGFIAGRRTDTMETPDQGAGQYSYSTSRNTHFEVTWQRANGSRQAREVSPSFYLKAQEGQPATLRLWREEVVGVEVMGEKQWFQPEWGKTLDHWLLLAFFGLGVLLWGLLFGWWDGFFMLAFRTFAWMFLGFVLVYITTYALTYGLDIGDNLVGAIVLGIFFIGVPIAMVVGSIAMGYDIIQDRVQEERDHFF